MIEKVLWFHCDFRNQFFVLLLDKLCRFGWQGFFWFRYFEYSIAFKIGNVEFYKIY